MLQKEIRTAINVGKMNDEGIFLHYRYDFSKVKEVLKSRPDLIDSQDEEGNTLLHHLVNPSVIIQGLSLKEILQYNPNPYIKNKDGLTPRLFLLADESFADKESVQNILAAHEQSYISTETGKIFQGIVLLMTKMNDPKTEGDTLLSYQENMTVSVLNLLGEGDKKLSYIREQNRVENHCFSVLKRKHLIENTLS